MLTALAVFLAISAAACALRTYEHGRYPPPTEKGRRIMEALLWIGLPAALLAAVVLMTLSALWRLGQKVSPTA